MNKSIKENAGQHFDGNSRIMHEEEGVVRCEVELAESKSEDKINAAIENSEIGLFTEPEKKKNKSASHVSEGVRYQENINSEEAEAINDQVNHYITTRSSFNLAQYFNEVGQGDYRSSMLGPPNEYENGTLNPESLGTHSKGHQPRLSLPQIGSPHTSLKMSSQQ